ncbi:hypothetical protein SUGI_0024780 [Cryptomeria japonica]|nr:hypothetical protein SUGI_0024780 [Cryptomeria japonica]
MESGSRSCVGVRVYGGRDYAEEGDDESEGDEHVDATLFLAFIVDKLLGLFCVGFFACFGVEPDDMYGVEDGVSSLAIVWHALVCLLLVLYALVPLWKVATDEVLLENVGKTCFVVVEISTIIERKGALLVAGVLVALFFPLWALSWLPVGFFLRVLNLVVFWWCGLPLFLLDGVGITAKLFGCPLLGVFVFICPFFLNSYRGGVHLDFSVVFFCTGGFLLDLCVSEASLEGNIDEVTHVDLVVNTAEEVVPMAWPSFNLYSSPCFQMYAQFIFCSSLSFARKDMLQIVKDVLIVNGNVDDCEGYLHSNIDEVSVVLVVVDIKEVATIGWSYFCLYSSPCYAHMTRFYFA